VTAPIRCVWCGADFMAIISLPNLLKVSGASKDILPMQFHLSMVTGREVASERSEGAGDRNADAGGYFLE
jgi:hypothetical protein